MTLYFAYGSNLLRSQMTERCPEHTVLSLASLPHHRFLIGERGYATIKPEAGQTVYGVIFQISSSDEANLDICEGVAKGCYQKQYHTLQTQDDKRIQDVLVYVDLNNTPEKPKPGYLEKILKGASEFKLPEDYQKYLSTFIA